MDYGFPSVVSICNLRDSLAFTALTSNTVIDVLVRLGRRICDDWNFFFFFAEGSCSGYAEVPRLGIELASQQ